MSKNAQWEEIADGAKRLRVYGGWFIVTTTGNAVGVFVPDVEMKWSLKHPERESRGSMSRCEKCDEWHRGEC